MLIAVLLGIAMIGGAAAFLYSVHTRREELRRAAETLAAAEGRPGAVDDAVRFLRAFSDYSESLQAGDYAEELAELRQNVASRPAAHLRVRE